jgi:hypothetical protein
MGPVFYLYNAEILNAKSNSFAIVINWITLVVVSYLTPLLLEAIHGKLFLIFSAFMAAHCVFAYFFMKETKGLTDTESKSLYAPK